MKALVLLFRNLEIFFIIIIIIYLCWEGIHQVLQAACVLKGTVSLVFVPVSVTWRIIAMPTHACGYALNS